jgi:hypothetical protein
MSHISTLAQRTIGTVIDDGLITAKIKSSYAADPQVSALAIDVDTVRLAFEKG